MRILAHIHTHNEAEFIERALAALQRQTRPPEAIVIVDNLSTDGTLDRIFPESVTVIRNPANIGVAGSVAVGLAHALKEKFDWTWVLDADSVPEPDALANLLSFFENSSAVGSGKCLLSGVSARDRGRRRGGSSSTPADPLRSRPSDG